MAYTNYCCRSGGSNLNAGTRTGDTTEPGTSASFTYASGTWVSSSGVFTVASGNPQSDGVAAGDMASVYADGATVTTLVGRVTAVSTTTITISGGAKSGTTTDGTSNRTLKIGGAWKGPNGTENFPFGFITTASHDGTNTSIRINLKNDASYVVSAAVASSTGSLLFEGYATSYSDGGKAIIDANANAIVVLTLSGANNVAKNLIITNNGASGSNAGLVMSGSTSRAIGCVAHDIRGFGINLSGASAAAIECEAYLCNGSNTSNTSGINLGTSGTLAVRCDSHDNSGSNSHGFTINNSQVAGLVDCIADTNGGSGVLFVTGAAAVLVRVDCYKNGADGVNATGGGPHLDSCNFVWNGAYGVRGNSAALSGYLLINCGFGAGTMANASGTTTGVSTQESGSVNYAADVTPWTDPENGDFRVSLAAAKGAGRGVFTQTQASYTGAVGYPDRGAVQHVDSGGSGGYSRGRTV